MCVRLLRPVACGEEVTIAYVDAVQPLEQRRAELYDKYGFVCGCERCVAIHPQLDAFLGRAVGAGSDEAVRKLEAGLAAAHSALVSMLMVPTRLSKRIRSVFECAQHFAWLIYPTHGMHLYHD
jgi:hypothetical protein